MGSEVEGPLHMAGVGEDTQAAGKKIENSADRNKRY